MSEENICCSVCGSSQLSLWATARDIEYFTSEQLYKYYRCAKCKILCIAPRPVNQLAQIYPHNYYSFSAPDVSLVNTVKSAMDRRIYKNILQSLPGATLNILDIGGGIGWHLDIIRSLDNRIDETVVLDIDGTMAEAVKRAGHKFINDRIESFTSTNSYDMVLMLNLIEHVEDPRSVLEKTMALLTENGRLLVKTPNTDSIDARLFRNHNWGGLHCPRHWTLFDREGMARLAREAGLEPIKFFYTQGAPFWAVSLLNYLSRYIPLKLHKERPLETHWLYKPIGMFFALIDFLRLPFSKTSQMFFVFKRAANKP